MKVQKDRHTCIERIRKPRGVLGRQQIGLHLDPGLRLEDTYLAFILLLRGVVLSRNRVHFRGRKHHTPDANTEKETMFR